MPILQHYPNMAGQLRTQYRLFHGGNTGSIPVGRASCACAAAEMPRCQTNRRGPRPNPLSFNGRHGVSAAL